MSGFRKAQPDTWKPVVGWEGIYEVGASGFIRRIKPGHCTHVGRILKPYSDKYGYLKTSLREPGRFQAVMVHQVVAAAFIGPKPTGLTVNHKNADQQDNRADNLEYLTSGDNSRHAASLGRRRGTSNANSKLSEADILSIRDLYKHGKTQVQIAALFSISQVQVSNIVRCKRGGWQHI